MYLLYKFGAPITEVVAHLLGENNQVELLHREGLLGNGTGILVVVIELFGGENDFFGVDDELIGSADVFVEHAFGETDGGRGLDGGFSALLAIGTGGGVCIEEFAGVEFAPSRHGEVDFAEHGRECVERVKGLSSIGGGEVESLRDYWRRRKLGGLL